MVRCWMWLDCMMLWVGEVSGEEEMLLKVKTDRLC